jgi:hypothetical protein
MIVSLLGEVRNGEVKIRIQNVEQDNNLKIWEQILGKLTAGLVISALIISSSVFIIATKESFTFKGLPLTLVLGLVGYAFAAFLSLVIIRAVKFTKKD